MAAGSVALVQGASRGLGLHFCRHRLPLRKEATVIATCRSPVVAPPLQALRSWLCFSWTPPGRRRSGRRRRPDYGRLDLLVNCGAVLHPSGRKETRLRDDSAEGLSVTLTTNSIGPFLVAKHFTPLLLNGTGTIGYQCSDLDRKHRTVLVNVSMKLGSIGDNALGGWYSYQMSKAALNMATQNFSIELGRGKAKLVCVSLHPGTADADLSRPYHKNVPKDKRFTPEYLVNCLMHIIDNLDMG